MASVTTFFYVTFLVSMLTLAQIEVKGAPVGKNLDSGKVMVMKNQVLSRNRCKLRTLRVSKPTILFMLLLGITSLGLSYRTRRNV